MRLSVDECSAAIALIGIIYQYLCIKIIRFSGSRQKRKSLRACLSVLLSEISSVVTPDDTHSASSSRTAVPNLFYLLFSQRICSAKGCVLFCREMPTAFSASAAELHSTPSSAYRLRTPRSPHSRQVCCRR